VGARIMSIGVIGYGMRGGDQLPLGSGAVIAAVADPDRRALQRAALRFGSRVRLDEDYRRLLDLPLDAVVIATPDDTHVQIAVESLSRGIPVFVEKPLATTTDGADQVLRAAMETGTKLYVGHNMRFTPVFVEMRRLIREGAIGRVRTIWCRHFVGHGGDFYFRDWHAERDRTTSLLLQKASHDIDVIHWLAGGVSRRVQAMGRLMVYGDRPRRAPGEAVGEMFDPINHWPPTQVSGLNPTIDVEDVSLVNMELSNGVLAAYQQCHFTPDYWRNFTVIGDEGRIENFGDGGEETATLKLWRKRSNYREDADLIVEFPPEEGVHGGDDERVWADFLEYVRNGTSTTVSPLGAREAVATGVAATESLRSGGRIVEVPAPDADLTDYFVAQEDS